MGFRNPARTATATAVDTTTLGKGGVLVQSVADPNSDGNTYGVVLFPDGIPGDSPSFIMGRPDYNPRAVASVLGGGLTLQCGTYAGRSGPSVQVKVESAADGTGSVSPVVRINSAGGRVLTDAPFEPVATAPVTFIAPPFINDPFTGNEQLTVYRLASGLYFLAGILQHTGATAISAGGAQIAAVPPGYGPPTGSTFLQGFFANAGGTVTCYLSADNGIYLAGGSPPIPAGSFLVFHSVYRTDVPKHA